MFTFNYVHFKFLGSLSVWASLSDLGGFNDSSAPLGKLSTWNLCHFFGNFVSLNLHIIESGDYGVEKLPSNKLATLLK